MQCLKIIIALLAVIVLGATLVLFTGLYNVAATEEHSAPVKWVLHEAMESSVHRHARGIEVPALDDSTMVWNGFQGFRAMCVECHGAPGTGPEEMARGLNPPAPELSESAEEWLPEELFWVTRHGIRMTGMPAWGVAHSDETLWMLTAFMVRMKGMSAEEYRGMVEALYSEPEPEPGDMEEEGGGHEGHEHGGEG